MTEEQKKNRVGGACKTGEETKRQEAVTMGPLKGLRRSELSGPSCRWS